MELNGFVIGPEIKKLFKIKVGTLIAKHPVAECDLRFGVVQGDGNFFPPIFLQKPGL